jgi:hypothetical protein
VRSQGSSEVTTKPRRTQRGWWELKTFKIKYATPLNPLQLRVERSAPKSLRNEQRMSEGATSLLHPAPTYIILSTQNSNLLTNVACSSLKNEIRYFSTHFEINLVDLLYSYRMPHQHGGTGEQVRKHVTGADHYTRRS